MISIRVMTGSDLEFADSLRAQEGWNQRLADWILFLGADPNGVFVAECDGVPVGTVATIRYGRELGWIGMMLVHRDYRRRGIGRALMKRALAHLRRRRVACIKLDATTDGKRLYETLGFREEGTLTRWQRPGPKMSFRAPTKKQVHAYFQSAPVIAALDRFAMGVGRRMYPLFLCFKFARREHGFGLIRPGSNVAYLGPVISTKPGEAFSIIEELIGDHGAIWDIPDPNKAAAKWAAAHGFVRKRSLTRMYFGERLDAPAPNLLYAIAGPELG